MDKLEKYIDLALNSGFTNAVLLRDLKLVCDPDIRALCTPDTCPNHGQNWVCPPGCGTLEECAAKAGKYNAGLLLQSVTDLPKLRDAETYARLNREHNLRFRALVERCIEDFGDVLPLTSGGCVFCETCAYPEPCVKPDMMMQSLSAFGVNVGNLCASAGLDFDFRDDKVFFVACLLGAF